MIMRRITTSWSVLLVLGLAVGCGDDDNAPSPPENSSSDSSAADASTGSNPVDSDSTTKDPVDSSGDAGAGETSSSSDPGEQTSATSVSSADSTSSGPVMSGDAGPSTDDTGAGECSPGSATAIEDECLYMTGLWCESFDAALTCSLAAFLKDEAVYDVLIACLNETFSEEGACDLSEDEMAAKVFECEALADATACPVEADACAVYADCEEYTVEECNAVAAKYNDDWVAVAEFGCEVSPAEALGEASSEE